MAPQTPPLIHPSTPTRTPTFFPNSNQLAPFHYPLVPPHLTATSSIPTTTTTTTTTATTAAPVPVPAPVPEQHLSPQHIKILNYLPKGKERSLSKICKSSRIKKEELVQLLQELVAMEFLTYRSPGSARYWTRISDIPSQLRSTRKAE